MYLIVFFINRFDDEIGRRDSAALLCLMPQIDYTKFTNIRVEYLGANMTRYIQLGIWKKRNAAFLWNGNDNGHGIYYRFLIPVHSLSIGIFADILREVVDHMAKVAP